MFASSDDTAEAAHVWNAIQAATAHEAINAQQILAPPGATEQLIPYLNGLIAEQCHLIITVGTRLHDAIVAVAQANPNQMFLNIGSSTTLPNIRDITNDTSTITELVKAAAHSPMTTSSSTPGTSQTPKK